MSGPKPLLDLVRRQAARLAQRNIDLPDSIVAWKGAGASGESDFERSMRLYPPGPLSHDIRGDRAQDLKRADISHLRPGDTVITDGATIRIDSRDGPIVSLDRGYENGRSAARLGPIITPVGPEGVSVDENIATADGKTPFWFRDQVRNHQPWDYKQRGREFQGFGNYNYGATGRALPLPTGILEREAGRAQVAAKTSKPEWGTPGPRIPPVFGGGSFGDDPVDQYWIAEGARYHDER